MILSILKKVFFSALVMASFLYSSVIDTYTEYSFRAWGIGGNKSFSETTLTVNGEVYTAFAYSKKNISQKKASLSGDFTIIALHLNNKIKNIKLSSDYKNSEVVVKIYKSNSLFDESTLAYETSTIYLDEDYIDQTIIIN